MAGGRVAWARKGRIIGSPLRPFGYRIIREYDDRGCKTACYFEIDEEEAEIVRQIFEWAAYDGLSTCAIAQKLTAAGVVTQRAKDPRYVKEDKPSLWHPTVVWQMLKNETYAGVWNYRKARIKRTATGPGKVHKETKWRAKDDPKRIAVPCPAIVDRELWKAAQKSVRARSNGGRKPSRQEFLLRGILKCGQCGYSMTGEIAKSKDTTRGYYRCRHHKSKRYSDPCPSRGNLRQEHADALVWGYITKMLKDGDDIRRQLERQREEAERASRTIAMSIAALDAQTEKDRGRLERLLDLYADGDLDKEQYKARTHKINGHTQEREQERADLEARMRSAGAFSEQDIEDFERMRTRALVATENATFEEKRQLLAMLGVKCIWDSETKELTVTGAFGGGKLSLTSGTHVGKMYKPFVLTARIVLPSRIRGRR